MVRFISRFLLFVAITASLSLGISCSSPAELAQPDSASLPLLVAPSAQRKIMAQESVSKDMLYAGVPDFEAPAMVENGLPRTNEFNTEDYDRIVDNPFMSAKDNPLSTFSVDVDTAGYSNMRRFLVQNSLPNKDAIRIEELLNYFPYAYAGPTGEHPVGTRFALAPAPWNPNHQLLRVAVKAREIETAKLPAANLVFLLDTSGSMSDENKLPLLKESLRILVASLRPQDKVSIVAYAGSAGVVLPSTPGTKKDLIIAAFDKLEAGGSTAGGEGIELAYKIARENFINGGNNRVILATDGDFNVGVSSTGDLERLIEEKRKQNVYLTVLGLGMGNYKDNRMETLSNKGNGNYAYIDNLLEGKKVLGKEIWGNLFAVAKDVKMQIEFNPAIVREYRLIGYENRVLAKEDFNDDSKDAGEMGSGQSVTAFYELVLADAPANPQGPEATKLGQGAKAGVDPLSFQESKVLPSTDFMAFKLRYKKPGDGNETSVLVESRAKLADLKKVLADQDGDFRFQTALIEAGMLLRDSPYKGSSAWDALIGRARQAKGEDYDGYRAEFVKLAEQAQLLMMPR